MTEGTQTDRRRTDFGMKLIYPFYLKKKAGIIIINTMLTNIYEGLTLCLLGNILCF